MSDVIYLQLTQMIAAYFFIVIVIFLMKILKFKPEKLIVLAATRMTLQLIIAGYVLTALFEQVSIVTTLAFLVVMLLFAIYTILNKIKNQISKEFKKIIVVTLITSTVSCLLFFMFFIIKVQPWYHPQYLIPIAGMLIGNSMNGISLAINQLVSKMKDQRPYIETALMLGADSKTATKKIASDVFEASIMPSVNSMLTTGIVFLPGMMTGQILSGSAPLTAIKYQIAILLAIFACVAISSMFLIRFGIKTYFNSNMQLR